ncbi:MAG TPA: cytochrome c oxidase assembly factor Coa1 family protein [Xanthomonadales bacterium]|nr:cytochrome c oxidase assembly factor Coa1 family protein [Xanthomonadales bacterium]
MTSQVVVKPPQASSRRTRWIVLSVLAGVLVLTAVAVVLLFIGIGAMFSGSEPYMATLARAQTSAEVVAVLGEPIEPHGMASGELSVSQGGGNVDLDIPVRGPKGEGVLAVEGTRPDGEWRYTRMELLVPDADPIDLLPPADDAERAAR